MSGVGTEIKMEILLRCVLLLVWSVFIKDVHGKGYCRFPAYIWTPLADGTHRKWLTETEYVRNTDIWEKQKEITATETEMTIKHKLLASCNNKQEKKKVPCFRKNLLHRIKCLSVEPGDKFRVQIESGEKSSFTCMKFTEVNKNILQIYQAHPKELNEDRLCYDESLQRQLWPWIAPVQSEWHVCPLIGGFDFGAFVNDKREVCTRVWRPSRLESECIYGEGLTFLFPNTNCNPFHDSDLLEINMQCWGDWLEGQFRFILVGEAGREPQYILRVPEDIDRHSEFPSQLYFSPVAPLSLDGSVGFKVRRLLLRMKRSERGVCYDESSECTKFAQQGKCTNSALHKYANFCKRSCGLCEFGPSMRPECRFPSSFQGDWVLFETNRKETAEITSGEAKFSALGDFICKSKHWSLDQYKLLSVFSNGCRPRYTCAHFANEGNKLLLFRISRSKLTDESFEMCQFQDDPLPLGNNIRSKNMKILFAKPSIQWGACGLTGEIRVNATFADGSTCNGKLTDWNELTCHSRAKLSLNFEFCRQRHSQEFVCIAHMSIDDSFSVLISQDTDGQRTFSCWTVRTYPERMSSKPWESATQLLRAQCGNQSDMQAVTPDTYRLVVRTYNDRVQQNCRKGNGRVIVEEIHTPSPTTRPTVKPTIEPLPISRTTRQPHIIIAPKERKSNSAPGLSGWGQGQVVVIVVMEYVWYSWKWISQC